MFRKYHYLNTDLHTAAQQYIGVINNEIVCHTGIIFFPMQKGKKRVHRLVVLPDYQGIGIGTKFIKGVAEIVNSEGYELNLTTTTPSLVGALKRDPCWILTRFGRTKGMGWVDAKIPQKQLGNASSENRITYSFWFNARNYS